MTPVFGASFKDNFEPHGDVREHTHVHTHTHRCVCTYGHLLVHIGFVRMHAYSSRMISVKCN